jgi:hypothetical protein
MNAEQINQVNILGTGTIADPFRTV